MYKLRACTGNVFLSRDWMSLKEGRQGLDPYPTPSTHPWNATDGIACSNLLERWALDEGFP